MAAGHKHARVPWMTCVRQSCSKGTDPQCTTTTNTQVGNISWAASKETAWEYYPHAHLLPPNSALSCRTFCECVHILNHLHRELLALTTLFKITNPAPNSSMRTPSSLLYFSAQRLSPSGILYALLAQVFFSFLLHSIIRVRRAVIFACFPVSAMFRKVPGMWQVPNKCSHMGASALGWLPGPDKWHTFFLPFAIMFLKNKL